MMTALVEVVWLMPSYPFLACIVYILILPVCSSERRQGHSPVSSSEGIWPNKGVGRETLRTHGPFGDTTPLCIPRVHDDMTVKGWY